MTWNKDRPCTCPRCVDCAHEHIRPLTVDALQWWCVSCSNVVYQEGTA